MIFFDRGTWRHVCNTHTCTQKISYFHVFLEKSHLSLSAQRKNMFSGKKLPSFQIIQERSCDSKALFEKTIFSESLKKISYFCVFLWERSSFICRLRCKIIFSGKRNIIFLRNVRKIIFHHNLFGKTIFSGRLEKENVVFCAVAGSINDVFVIILMIFTIWLIKTKWIYSFYVIKSFTSPKFKDFFLTKIILLHFTDFCWQRDLNYYF